MNFFLETVGFGLITASVFAMGGVGLSLQFSVTNFINFAYGDFATLAAYMALVAIERGVNVWVGLLIAALGAALFSLLIYQLVLRSFVRRGARLVVMLIVTLGLSLIIQNGISSIWGTNFQTYSLPPGQPFHVGPFIWTWQEVTIMLIAVGLLVLLHGMLRYTPIGKAMRAMSDNSELAEVCGIRTAMVMKVVWLVSGALVGVAGVVLAINTATFTPLLGTQFLFFIFATVIVGGIGRIYGAMLGALAIGLTTEVAGAYIGAAYGDAIAFVVMIVILLIRPQGLFVSAGKT